MRTPFELEGPRNHRWDADTETVIVACDDLHRRSRLCCALRRAGYAVIQDRAADGAGRHLPERGTSRRNDAPLAAAVVVAPPEAVSAWRLVERLRFADWALPIVVLAAPDDAQASNDARLLCVDAMIGLGAPDLQTVAAIDALVHDDRLWPHPRSHSSVHARV